jgi:hypothetical protein
MGIFSFLTARTNIPPHLQEAVAEYQRLRRIRLRLNSELASRLPRDVVNEGAKKIGIFQRGKIVLDCEDQVAVLMDYCIYDVYRRGRNAIDQYLCESRPDPDSDELTCLNTMQNATFALLVVREVVPGVGCYVQNLFTEETRLIIDTGLSQTAKQGLVLATRILDFDDYVTTSGAALPISVLDSDELDEWQQRLSTGVQVDRYDPAPLIRRAIRGGASEQVLYSGTDSEDQFDPGDFAPPPRTPPAQRRRTVAKTKTAANRRCKCGSGKMYKNCCGKRQS